METRAPMELRGSGPISGPMGGGFFPLAAVCGTTGFTIEYVTFFLGAAAEVFCSFMAESVEGEACSGPPGFGRPGQLHLTVVGFVYFLYFSTVCAVFQPLQAKKQQNNPAETGSAAMRPHVVFSVAGRAYSARMRGKTHRMIEF